MKPDDTVHYLRVRSADDRFRCDVLQQALTAARCVGNQIAARDTEGAEFALCRRCAVGLRVAHRVGVEFDPRDATARPDDEPTGQS